MTLLMDILPSCLQEIILSMLSPQDWVRMLAVSQGLRRMVLNSFVVTQRDFTRAFKGCMPDGHVLLSTAKYVSCQHKSVFPDRSEWLTTNGGFWDHIGNTFPHLVKLVFSNMSKQLKLSSTELPGLRHLSFSLNELSIVSINNFLLPTLETLEIDGDVAWQCAWRTGRKRSCPVYEFCV